MIFMNYYKNGRLLAKAFIEGETNGTIGREHHPGNLRIVGTQLFHYETPILERCDDGEFILNVARYSRVTGVIQKWLKNETLNNIPFKEAHKVEIGYKGSLKDYVKHNSPQGE